MTEAVTIAVAVPTYKRPEYLKKLLDGVPADIKAFVSDNAASLQGCEVQFGDNVKISHADCLLPIFANWNRALSLIGDDATHIMIPSDDDLFCPGAFERVREVIAAKPDTDIYIFGCDLVDGEGVSTPGYAPAELKWLAAGDGFFAFEHGVDARMPGVVFSKPFLDRIGGFDERFLLTAADSELIQRALILGRAVFCPDVIAYYRVWPGGLTHSRQATDEWIQEIQMWVAKTSALWESTYGTKGRGFDPQAFADEIIALNLLSGVHGLIARGEWVAARDFLRRHGIPRHARLKTSLRLWHCRARMVFRVPG